MKKIKTLLVATLAFAATGFAGEALSPEVKAKVEAKIASLKAWGSEAVIVKATKESAANPAAKDMTQDKWKGLTVIDPTVRSFTQNPAAAWIKGHKDPAVSEMFISNAAGTKVAFLAKPSGWSHKGKPKHDVPMTGKTWIGDAEMDESTGQKQVQVAFPVLDAGKPIGSIVVGLAISKL
jgi:hypothetical protein